MDTQSATDIRDRLRSQALTARKELSEAERRRKSGVLCESLVRLLDGIVADAGRQAQDCVVAAYAASGTEVALDTFIEAVFGRGMQLAFPCMLIDRPNDEGPSGKGDARMEMRLVDEQHYHDGEVPFVTDPFSTREAGSAQLSAFPPITSHKPLLTVVPVVAFDRQGNRLGYGRGNYDRYLEALGPSSRRIGVAFAEQEVESIPVQAGDQRLEVLSC